MFKIRKIFKWEGSHRLISSYSTACQRLHGHSYICEVIISAEELNEDGMVVDFGQVKEQIQCFFDLLDHRVMLHKGDTAVNCCEEDLITVSFNPTAENMALDLYKMIAEKLKKFDNIKKLAIRIHETATGWAEFSEEEF